MSLLEVFGLSTSTEYDAGVVLEFHIYLMTSVLMLASRLNDIVEP